MSRSAEVWHPGHGGVPGHLGHSGGVPGHSGVQCQLAAFADDDRYLHTQEAGQVSGLLYWS